MECIMVTYSTYAMPDKKLSVLCTYRCIDIYTSIFIYTVY